MKFKALEILHQYGEIFAEKDDELILLEKLEDGRLWVKNAKTGIEFAITKDEITKDGVKNDNT